MKESIIVLFFFSFGVLGGRLDLLPADWLGLVHEASNLAVYAMLAAVGMSLGFDSRAWRILRDLKGWVVLVPLMIIVGTFLGGVAAWTMLDMSFRDVMAVAAGFGYYTNAARDFAQFSARFCTPLTCAFYNWHTVCKEPGEFFLRALCFPFVRTLYLFKIPLPGFLLWNKSILSTLGFKEPNPLVQLLCPTDIKSFG